MTPLPHDPCWVHHHLPLDDGKRGNLHYVTVHNLPATGPLVLLLHGWPEFWYSWRRQLSVLAAAGYKPYALDLRGFGASTVAPGRSRDVSQYTFKQTAQDCVELLDSLGADQAILIGHDWGGAAVWRAALRYPARFVAVASVCSPYRPRSSHFHSPADIAAKVPSLQYQVYFARRDGADAAKDFDANLSKTFTAILRGAASPIPQVAQLSDASHFFDEDSFRSLPAPPTLERCPLFSKEELDAYVLAYARAGGFAGPMMWYCTSRLNWEDEQEHSAVVSQPSLMVTAGKDKALVPAMTRGMEKWIPHLTRGHIEESGHWAATEQPDALNKVLLAWLGGLARGNKTDHLQSRL